MRDDLEAPWIGLCKEDYDEKCQRRCYERLIEHDLNEDEDDYDDEL